MSDWRDRALCAQVDPDLWFPEKGQSPHAAQRICAQCPVREQCLAEALANHEWWGVWGGLSYRQRLEIQDGAPVPAPLPAAREATPTPRRNRGSQGCGTSAGYHRHWRAHETPCQACTEAHNRAAKARNAARAARSETLREAS